MPHASIRYKKPAKTPIALLRHLGAKGLIVRGQQAQALTALQFIGYYRLLIYMRPLQIFATKTFHPNVYFNDILAVYDFDRNLRLVCLDAIERIEVAIRSVIINILVPQKTVGPHFYLDSIHFENDEVHRNFMRVAVGATTKNLPIKHYYENYNSPSLPPIWAILETVTFGNISVLFSTLHIDHRKKIAASFNYDETVLVSWFKTINLLRNLCAHHSRLWNANHLTNAPKYASRIVAEFPHNNDRGKFSAKAVVLAALLKEIDPTSDWKRKFKVLMASFPTVSLNKAGVTQQAMGFTPGWELSPFWS